jgi:hypothetical protein
MNDREIDEKIRRALRSQRTIVPNKLEGKIMNTLTTVQKKRNRLLFLIPIAAALLVLAGVAAFKLLPGKAPDASLSTDNGSANGSELSQNFKEYKTIDEARAKLGMDILTPGYAVGGAAYEKVVVYFAGTDPNSVVLTYRQGGKNAYQVGQTIITKADAKAYVEQFVSNEKADAAGVTVYLTQNDGAFDGEVVKDTTFINVSSLDEKLSKDDVLKIVESMLK